MSKIEQSRKTWQGKSDEWLYERLALELTQKVEEIHKLLAENKQLGLELNQTKKRWRYRRMSKEISREEFERLVKVYSTKLCSEIIKNGFEGVESWLRVAMSETLNRKINQNKEDDNR